jgi:tetrahydromethanopterin S-methyltransferase subunit G
MKKLILIVAALAAGWLGLNYLRTGEFTLSPAGMSEAERRLADLEEELAHVKAEIAQAGRSASMAGIDTTADVESLARRQEELEKKIAEARKSLE